VEEKNIVKIIGCISIILGCYYLFLLYVLFDIGHNISLILNINTSQMNYENALTALFIFAAFSIIPSILYVIGGFLIFKLRKQGRSIVVGTLALTLLTIIFNAKAILLEIKQSPIVNTIYYLFYALISTILLFFFYSQKVKTIFHVKYSKLHKFKSATGRINDILVDTNVIRRGKKTYLPAWSVIATFLLPMFLIYLAIEYSNIIFAWLIIPCMIIFPLIGGYFVKKRKTSTPRN